MLQMLFNFICFGHQAEWTARFGWKWNGLVTSRATAMGPVVT